MRKKTTVSISLPLELIIKLEAYLEENKLGKSFFFRELLEEFFLGSNINNKKVDMTVITNLKNEIEKIKDQLKKVTEK